MTILERIKLNSAKHPERVVMRTQYGFGEMTMKWGELDAFSDKLAYYLTKELRTNKPIIVYGHKHPMILVCFLACVKSGRAYCPIDVKTPVEQNSRTIKNRKIHTINLGVSLVNCTFASSNHKYKIE